MVVGYNLSDDEFIRQLLNGLPSEYDAVVTNMNSQKSSLGIDEVLSLLMTHEIRLQHTTIDPHQVAHVAEKQDKKNDESSAGHGVILQQHSWCIKFSRLWSRQMLQWQLEY